MTDAERELLEMIRDSKDPAKAAAIALATIKDYIKQQSGKAQARAQV